MCIKINKILDKNINIFKTIIKSFGKVVNVFRKLLIQIKYIRANMRIINAIG